MSRRSLAASGVRSEPSQIFDVVADAGELHFEKRAVQFAFEVVERVTRHDEIGMRAYEDQCAPANPRIPMIEDMKDIAIAAYYGVSQAEGHRMRVERRGEAATEEASERA